MSGGASLKDLVRDGAGVAVPRPPSRVMTRVLLPMAVLLAALGVLGYSARDALWPAREVWVSPVVTRPMAMGEAGARRSGGVVQAPGWIEPAPYAITVPALEEGVVSEVLVLEGERVQKGQVVARMVDAEAKLEVELGMVEVAAKRHMLAAALTRREAASAEVDLAKTTLARALAQQEAGGMTAGEVAEVRAAVAVKERQLEAMFAEARAVEGEVPPSEVRLKEAQLKFSRMTIVSPCDGVVMALGVEPGMRISMGPGSDPKQSGVVRLYDPTKLQVRVDVPLSEAAMVEIGGEAEVSTESLPGRVFAGVVARAVHEANIQRNTVQFKITLAEPDAVMKPEMLARVKIRAKHAPREEGEAAREGEQGEAMLAPASAVRTEGGERAVWVVGRGSRGGSQVAVRRVVVPEGGEIDGYIVLTSGVSPGDLVIMDAPADLKDGDKLKVLGERLAPGGEE